ncbi:peptide chain release factor N(5)-glutamine methyltransferase [Pelagibacteraceae bacterium]|nr:peptide chain release factor N(5)-glutamine methyltransferase [Pelagibacteraceae bacterium]
MLISELISLGSKELKLKKIPSHLLDSELIISNILQQSREKTITSNDKKVSLKNISNFKKFIKRRLRLEPMAYIFNEKDFWTTKFNVNKNTLIPRPETELLVEQIVKILRDKKTSILDIGTGSGCIVLSILLELKNCRGIGVDISKEAIRIANKNAKKLKLIERVKFYNRPLDLYFRSKFDVVVSNPPYICNHQIKNLAEDVRKYEPRIALNGGNDGLDVIKKVIYKSRTILKRKGILALEIGRGQYKKVSKILKLQGFKDRYLISDYQKNIRCVFASLEN